MGKKTGKINEMDKKSPFSDGMKIRFRRKNLHDAEAGKVVKCGTCGTALTKTI